MIRAKHLFVLEQRLGGLAIVDLGDQTAPRADRRLQHHRVAHLLDRAQRLLWREGISVRGVGTPCLISAWVVLNLSPHTSATAAVFTVGTPASLSAFSA